MPISGTAGNPITIQGELNANGDSVSIVDPYVDVSGGWTHTENGVYTKDIGWKPWALAIEIGGTRYKIQRLCQVEDNPELQRYQDFCSNWQTHLARPNTTTYTKYPITINFWDGYEALFSSSADGTTYVSFRADDDVSDKTLYAAIDASSSSNSTIKVSGSYITIKDLEIRALDYGIFSNTGSNIIVDNNKIILGNKKIQITGSNNHIISNNILTNQTYSDAYVDIYDRGAWSAVNATYTTTVKNHLYSFTKYGLTADDGQGESSGVIVDGNNILITGNEMSYMAQGIDTWNSSYYEIVDNYIHNLSSTAFGAGAGSYIGRNSSIHDNIFSDSNLFIRYQTWNGSSSQATGSNSADIKIYRNTFWLPADMGSHVFFHYLVRSSSGGTINQVGKAWFYHNSFSGGNKVIQVSSSAKYYSPSGMGDVYFVDNVMSSNIIYDDQSYVAVLGGGWYNWLAGVSKESFSHTSNYDNGTTLMWGTPTLHNFSLPQNSNTIDAGIDLSKSFIINGVTYSALPGMTQRYFSGSAPDMGAIEYTGSQTLQGDIDNNGVVNSLDWSIMNTAWGTADPVADINKDGVVNTIDWSIMNGEWEQSA